jgi:hypothetical protein
MCVASDTYILVRRSRYKNLPSVVSLLSSELEAGVGIEPAYTALQAAA